MTLTVRGSFDLSKIRRAPAQAAPEALALGMEHIRQIAASRTPVETGHLVGSAEVGVDESSKTASLTYPGPYARYQHYELQLHHETGEPLYLETSINDGAREALDIIAKEVRKAL